MYRKNVGYADRQNNILADDDTVFEWGSATKILVWVSIMQLKEQGKLNLDEPIQTYLPPNFLQKLTYNEPITIRNLMNHNAGWEDTIVGLFESDESNINSLEKTLKQTQPRQIFKPGEVTAYSNWGVALAGYIVEQISGLEFYQYVHQNIFSPLGMNTTAVNADLSDNLLVQTRRNNIRGYAADGQTPIPDKFSIPLYPAGMSTGTLSDFLKLAQALVPPQGESGVLFEKRETLEELYSPTLYYGASTLPRNCHGLWVNLYKVPVIGHGGNTAAMSSYLLIDPQSRCGVVVMTNQGSEQIYNSQLAPLVFGTLKNATYLPQNADAQNQLGSLTNCQGLFTSARTILSGPCLMYGFLSIIPVPRVTEKKVSFGGMDIELITDSIINISGPTTNIFAVYVTDSIGQEKLSMPYMDMIKTSWLPFVCRFIAIALCVLMFLYTVTILIIGLIHKIGKKSRVVAKFHYRFCAVSFASVVCVVLFAVSLLTFQTKSLLLGILIVFDALIIIQLIYGVYTIYRLCSKRIVTGKTTAILNIITVFANLFCAIVLQLVPIL